MCRIGEGKRCENAWIKIGVWNTTQCINESNYLLGNLKKFMFCLAHYLVLVVAKKLVLMMKKVNRE